VLIDYLLLVLTLQSYTFLNILYKFIIAWQIGQFRSLHDSRSPMISSWATFKAVGKQTFSGGGGELYVRTHVGKHHPESGGRCHKVLRYQSSSDPAQVAYRQEPAV